ncbi:MAG: outer membrane protein assembly factor BamA [Rhodobacterales bacterium]|nr:MAG: outer membrane protein assembly factor BamA [Rhodobacterales bacterium]
MKNFLRRAVNDTARNGAAGGLHPSAFVDSTLKPAAVAVVLGASAILPGGAVAADYAFSSVQIEGLAAIDPGTVTTLLGFDRGEPVSGAQLNDGYQRLAGSGLFDRVELIPRGGTLIVRVTEFPVIARINVEGNKRLKDKAILEMITSQARHMFNPATAEADADVIARAYAAGGRLAATVTPRIIRRPNNTVDLVFEVVEGKNTEIERITFTGNRAFSDSRLRRVVSSKQAGVFRFLVQADTFDPGRVEFDKRLLKDFYASRGYPDFDAVAVTSEIPGQEDAYYVTYEIREGQQFSFGRITSVSEVEGIVAADYQGYANIRQGSTYNPDMLDRAVQRMEKALAQAGYSFVRVDPRVTRNERAGTLDIELAIVRGSRVVVERIDIEGNETTLDRVIRTQFTTVEGDPFNPRAIRAAAERIRALGYFSNVDVSAREGSSSDSVVVDVDVEETGTGSFSAGATYQPGEGVGFVGAFTETNFLGRGQFLKLEFTGGTDQRNYAFSFAEPNLLGRKLTLGLDASFADRSWSGDFQTTAGKFEPYIQFPVGELSNLRLRAGARYSDMKDYTGPSAILAAENARGEQYGAFAGLTYTFNTARNGLDEPTTAFFKVSADVGGFGSDNQYLRGSFLGNVTSTAFHEDVTLKATVEGGAIASLGNDAPGTRIADRFMMSPQQVLGFASQGMGPRDGTSEDQALGGNFYAAARLEADFPIGLPEEYGISGALFAHAGSVWGLDVEPSDGADDFYLRSSAGAALDWKTPIGPLRFYYAVPLQIEEQDEERRYGVSISAGF